MNVIQEARAAARRNRDAARRARESMDAARLAAYRARAAAGTRYHLETVAVSIPPAVMAGGRAALDTARRRRA